MRTDNKSIGIYIAGVLCVVIVAAGIVFLTVHMVKAQSAHSYSQMQSTAKQAAATYSSAVSRAEEAASRAEEAASIAADAANKAQQNADRLGNAGDASTGANITINIGDDVSYTIDSSGVHESDTSDTAGSWADESETGAIHTVHFDNTLVSADNIEVLTDGTVVYTVQKNDTLCLLSDAFNVSVDELVIENHIRDASWIYEGEALRIPTFKSLADMN